MYNKLGYVDKKIINVVENSKRLYKEGQKKFSKKFYN